MRWCEDIVVSGIKKKDMLCNHVLKPNTHNTLWEKCLGNAYLPKVCIYSNIKIKFCK